MDAPQWWLQHSDRCNQDTIVIILVKVDIRYSLQKILEWRCWGNFKSLLRTVHWNGKIIERSNGRHTLIWNGRRKENLFWIRRESKYSYSHIMPRVALLDLAKWVNVAWVIFEQCVIFETSDEFLKLWQLLYIVRGHSTLIGVHHRTRPRCWHRKDPLTSQTLTQLLDFGVWRKERIREGNICKVPGWACGKTRQARVKAAACH